MNVDLLLPEVQHYIKQQTNQDVVKLAFAKNPFPKIVWTDIINQIAARSKAEHKLPTWFATDGILYPSKVSVEQTSSEKTANFKSKIISGNVLADLTGGFGIDSFFFSKHFQTVIHCEQDLELHSIVDYNFKVLNAFNIQCFGGDCTTFLDSNAMPIDWIYIDPSRRNDLKNRVFLLSDCEPNVVQLLPKYLSYSENILIKAAPILDITAAISELQFVSKVHIIALQNEVKEVLFQISKNYSGPILIQTSNLKAKLVERFEFEFGSKLIAPLSVPQKYLYEPNAAIMKSGGFEDIALAYNIEKLHRHTHLYTSNSLHADFPGRIFEIKNVLNYNKNDMKKLQNSTANVTIRNFPDKVEAIRKKWKISDGGNSYIFFTTNLNESKIALLCTKLKTY